MTCCLVQVKTWLNYMAPNVEPLLFHETAESEVLHIVKMVFTSKDFYTRIFAKSNLVNPRSLHSQKTEIRVALLTLKCLLMSRYYSCRNMLVLPHVTLAKTSI